MPEVHSLRAETAAGVDEEDDNSVVARGAIVGIGTTAGVGVVAVAWVATVTVRWRCAVYAGIRRGGRSVTRIVFLARSHRREFDATTHRWMGLSPLGPPRVPVPQDIRLDGQPVQGAASGCKRSADAVCGCTVWQLGFRQSSFHLIARALRKQPCDAFIP